MKTAGVASARPHWYQLLRRQCVKAMLLFIGCFATVSCLDFSTDPGEILYLVFERLPFPAVALGDSLRDSSGVAIGVSASAVNAAGQTVTNAPIRYYALGGTGTSTSVTVDSTTGVIVAGSDEVGTVRIIASLPGLQSSPLPLTVTRSPDSISVEVPTDTVSYSFTDTTLNFSKALTVTVLHEDSTGFYSPVAGWVARFTLESATDTVHSAVVNEQNRRLTDVPSGLFHIDTTGTDGTAARKLRVRPGPPLGTPLDSVVVLAEVRHKGEHIRGSPFRITVFVRPRA